MTSVGSNFLCGRPHGAYPPPPTGVHLSLIPSTLRVDVINGWPLYIIIMSAKSTLQSDELWGVIKYRIYPVIELSKWRWGSTFFVGRRVERRGRGSNFFSTRG